MFLFQVNFLTTQIAIDILLQFYAVIKDGRYAQQHIADDELQTKKGETIFISLF